MDYFRGRTVLITVAKGDEKRVRNQIISFQMPG